MTTILLINAVSSLLAGAGVGGWFVHNKRRISRNAVVRPVYVTTGTPRPLPRD